MVFKKFRPLVTQDSLADFCPHQFSADAVLLGCAAALVELHLLRETSLQQWAKEVYICECVEQFTAVLLSINYCIIFHVDKGEPIFANPCTLIV